MAMGDVSFEGQCTSKICDSESEDESPSRSDRSHSIDADEGICLTFGDRADSGIDVSLLSRPTSLHRSNHLQKCSAHTSQHPKSTGLALFAGKQLFCEKLIANQISTLLRCMDKVRLSRHNSSEQGPRPPSKFSTIMFGGLIAEIPGNFQHANKVHVGRTHQSGGSRGSHRRANERRYKPHSSFQDNDKDDEDDIRAPEHDGDPETPSGINCFGRYPCIFHNVGAVDPTPGCHWPRKYTSQLKTHHFHHDHPNGPFGCCGKCFRIGFTTKETLQIHEANCNNNICIDESCDNYGYSNQNCRHRLLDRSQIQIWSMWYRIAHGLSRFQAVPELPDPHPQQLLPPSSTPTPLARTRSSPGTSTPQAVLRTTLAPQWNAELIAGPSSHTPTVNRPIAPARMTVSSTREELVGLVTELLERLQADSPEVDVDLHQLRTETLDAAKGVLRHPDLEYVASIKRLCNLVAQCWRLLTQPTERTPNAWSALALRAKWTLRLKLPAKPPASWSPQQENLAHPSTSSLNGMGTLFGSYMDPGTQQVQHHLHSHQQQRQPAYDTAMDDPPVNMSVPTFTLTNPSDAMQSAGSSAFQSTNLDIDSGMWPNMNSSNPPWNPFQMSRGNLSNPAYGLPQPAQNPAPTTQNSSFPYGAQAHFHPNQTYMPDGSESTDWDLVSRADSAAYSGTLSNSFNYGERGNQYGKGKGPANDGIGGATSSRYGGGDL